MSGFTVSQADRYYSQTPPGMIMRTYMNPTESFEAFTPGIPGPRHISKNDDLMYQSVSGANGIVYNNRNERINIPLSIKDTQRFREINPQDVLKGGKKRKCIKSRKSRRSRRSRRSRKRK